MSRELSPLGPQIAVNAGEQVMTLYTAVSSNVTDIAPKSEPAADAKLMSLPL
eukprot:CAMPEP_0117505496 /NCGR_PEP_ID=MMETSP0784-20121206/25408_1 /TAXON_ID=39447 /ORGANISM="" /LENGTH=51 /DNA_ID=CAMNT_0005300911 /DNA_START=450 /DNA_END=601 /DNA_ORIENTATION=-